MNSRLSVLARRITAIKKEYSEREIEAALKLLEEQGSQLRVFGSLATVPTVSSRRSKSHRLKKSIQEQRSKAVIKLQNEDPDKYRILSEFDSLLRKGAVLPRVNDIKCLGESLNKDFTSRSSRRDAISKLMDTLAVRSLKEIRTVVSAVLSNDELDRKESDYQRLADFIITGKTSHTQRDAGPRAL